MERRQFLALSSVAGLGLIASPSVLFAQELKEILTEWRGQNFYGTILWDTNDAEPRVSVDVFNGAEPSYLWTYGDTIKRQGVIIQDGECFVHWQGRPQKKKFKQGVNRFKLKGTNEVIVVNGANRLELGPGIVTVLAGQTKLGMQVCAPEKTYLIEKPFKLSQLDGALCIYTALEEKL